MSKSTDAYLLEIVFQKYTSEQKDKASSFPSTYVE